MGSLSGKVALITGAARGQGEAEAVRFVEEGASVLLADVLADEAKAVADRLGEAAAAVVLDVSMESDWAAALDEAQARFGGLDVLVNNAGVVHIASIGDTSLKDYRRVIDINQVGVFLGIRGAAERMRDGGSIINVSSIDGLIGMPFLIAYVASKFAVRGMTKSAALELAPRGIRVNSIHPGLIDTPMNDRPEIRSTLPTAIGGIPLQRAADAREVAELALFLASDASSYSTGAEFVIDGGITAGHNFPRAMINNGRLADRVAIVTGGTGGLGRGIACELAAAGATVYLTGRDAAKLGAITGRISQAGGTAHALVCDHRDDSAVASAFERVNQESGRLDVLVNAVATLPNTPEEFAVSFGPFWQSGPEEWDLWANIGLRSHYVAAIHAARQMVAQGSGLIVNVSAASAAHYFHSVAYGVGKAALDRFTADAATQLREHGVSVVSIWPGGIRSEKTESYAGAGLTSLEDSETPEFAGRAVIALATDPGVQAQSGKAHFVAALARSYGFTELDGSQPGLPTYGGLLQQREWPDGVETLEMLIAATGRGDHEAAAALLHPDITVDEPTSLPYGGVHHGKHAFFEDVLGGILRRGNLTVGETVLRDAGDVVLVQMMVTVKAHETNRSVTVPFVELYTVEDGLVTSIDVYPKDTATYREVFEP